MAAGDAARGSAAVTSAPAVALTGQAPLGDGSHVTAVAPPRVLSRTALGPGDTRRIELQVGPADKPLSAYTAWELLNLSIDDTIRLRRDVAAVLREREGPERFHTFAAAVRAERIESLGTAGFFMKHGVEPPRVLVAASAVPLRRARPAPGRH